MKTFRAIFPATLLLLVLSTPTLRAAEEHGEGGGESKTLIFQIVNFAMLAGLMGYLIKKNLGPYFASRSESIRNEIADAQKLLKQSEERTASIQARIAGLDREVAELRSKAKAELEAEHARLEREAEQSMRRISTQAEQEIAATAKAARLELKAYAASLAVGLAAKKLEGRVDEQIQKGLVEEFVRGLRA